VPTPSRRWSRVYDDIGQNDINKLTRTPAAAAMRSTLRRLREITEAWRGGVWACFGFRVRCQGQDNVGSAIHFQPMGTAGRSMRILWATTSPPVSCYDVTQMIRTRNSPTPRFPVKCTREDHGGRRGYSLRVVNDHDTCPNGSRCAVGSVCSGKALWRSWRSYVLALMGIQDYLCPFWSC